MGNFLDRLLGRSGRVIPQEPSEVNWRDHNWDYVIVRLPPIMANWTAVPTARFYRRGCYITHDSLCVITHDGTAKYYPLEDCKFYKDVIYGQISG